MLMPAQPAEAIQPLRVILAEVFNGELGILPVRNISDCAFVADEVVGPGFFEVLVQDAVEAFGFVLVTVYAVFDLFGGVAGELYS